MAKRFFIDSFLAEDTVLLTREDTHHILHVMRKNLGDKTEGLDGKGKVYDLRLSGFLEGQLEAKVVGVTSSPAVAGLRLTLLPSLCKKDKMDLIVQKATELGVTDIRPVKTARSEVRLDDKRAEKKFLRYQKIAREATKQCRRTTLPGLYPIMDLKEALKDLPQGGLLLVFWEKARTNFKALLTELSLRPDPYEEIWMLVGPEGGLTQAEVDDLSAGGAVTVGLGQRILRAETASIFAVGTVLFFLEDDR